MWSIFSAVECLCVNMKSQSSNSHICRISSNRDNTVLCSTNVPFMVMISYKLKAKCVHPGSTDNTSMDFQICFDELCAQLVRYPKTLWHMSIFDNEETCMMLYVENVLVAKIYFGAALMRWFHPTPCQTCGLYCYRSARTHTYKRAYIPQCILVAGQTKLCKCDCHTRNECTIVEVNRTTTCESWQAVLQHFAELRPVQKHVVMFLANNLLNTDCCKLLMTYLW